VAAASDSLEQIIRDELRAPVSELVREQMNGAAPSLGPSAGVHVRQLLDVEVMDEGTLPAIA
jgi:hypothetical protein